MYLDNIGVSFLLYKKYQENGKQPLASMFNHIDQKMIISYYHFVAGIVYY